MQIFYAFLVFVTLTLTVPPAAKVLAIVAVIYALIQGLKKIPTLAPYLQGWIAIAVNVALSTLSLVLTVPAAQLYSTDTLLAIVTTALAAAGIHGTVKGLAAPSSSPTPDVAPATQPSPKQP